MDSFCLKCFAQQVENSQSAEQLMRLAPEKYVRQTVECDFAKKEYLELS